MRTNAQASNLIETVAIRNHLKRTFDANSLLQGIRPEPYSSNSYINHPESLTTAQLWAPIEQINLTNENPNERFQHVAIAKIKRAITKFYCRIYSVSRLQRDDPPISMDFTVAHRVVLDAGRISSERYREKNTNIDEEIIMLWLTAFV